jgi:DNA-directed RNA polymerase subunit RPC12/RpoP
MIEGKCTKCGQQYWGWSLLNHRNQSCGKCGAGLTIYEDGKKILDGYSPFTAEEYKLKSANPTLPETSKGKTPQ